MKKVGIVLALGTLVSGTLLLSACNPFNQGCCYDPCGYNGGYHGGGYMRSNGGNGNNGNRHHQMNNHNHHDNGYNGNNGNNHKNGKMKHNGKKAKTTQMEESDESTPSEPSTNPADMPTTDQSY